MHKSRRKRWKGHVARLGRRGGRRGGGRRMHLAFWWESHKERDPLGMIWLVMVGWHDSCKHDNEPLDSTKYAEILE
jgi:hypothetical protein